MSELITAKIDGKKYRLLAEDKTFWRRVEAGEWEADTLRVLARFLRRDSIYLDVGAWIGATALFAAARCREVYCVEPDPAAYERLLANLRMNNIKNALTFHGALGAKNARVKMSCARGLGKSMTRVRAENEIGNGETADALSVTPARFVKWCGIAKIDLLKIDIEGGEFALAPALAKLFPRMKPVIHLSLHAPFFPESARAEKLARIVGLAGNYKFCYDGNLNKISPREMLSDKFANHFAAVVLADAEF